MCGGTSSSLRPATAPGAAVAASASTAIASGTVDLSKVQGSPTFGGKVDWTKPIEAIGEYEDRDDRDVDTYPVRLLAFDGQDGDYKTVAIIDDEGTKHIDFFDNDGDAESVSYIIRNVLAPAASDEGDEDDDKSAVVLPTLAQFRVRHSKRGAGLVIKIRPVEGKSMLIRPDSGGKNFWALDKNVNRI